MKYRRMISKGQFVLCYDEKMKLVSEIGPFKTDIACFKRVAKEISSGKFKHVEAAEKVVFIKHNG
jgi:hypothetical protein